MGERSSNTRSSSRLGLRNSAVGEIVEVQGGHIVRSIGRKDRHSKVCTAKGPRDRRVRLAAHTAIQFYDVQDRLGYDRPSKAVDWLIKKAKSAIDELAQLPPWHPTSQNPTFEQEQQQQQIGNISGPSNKRAVEILEDEEHNLNINSSNAHNSSFLPPSLDSDAIADTIKSFFPVGASSADASSSSLQFQGFQSSDLLPRNGGHSQDLRLSLQSFQDPILLHQSQSHSHVLLSGTPLGFESWPEQQAGFQKLAPWNFGGENVNANATATATGYYFNPPQATPLLGQHNNQFFTQRGPLQSSNTPSVRAWMDPSAIAIATNAVDNIHNQHHQHTPVVPIYPSSISGIGFASGFHIPARIQGDEEEHDGYSDKPSSASSDSRH